MKKIRKIDKPAKEKKKLSKKAKLIICISLTTLSVIVISFFCGFFTYSLYLGKDATSVSWAIKMIDKYGCYYDEDSGEIKEFTKEDYISMITSSLDKYSTFYTKEEYYQELQTSKGNNYGLGIVVAKNSDNNFFIYRLVWNSPAEKSGIMVGDVLKKCIYKGETKDFDSDNLPTTFMNSIKENDEVTFIVQRGDEEKSFTIKKCVYKANYVKYIDNEKSFSFISDNGESLKENIENTGNSSFDSETAMISLYLFEGNADDGLISVMNYMKQRGKTKLILDLRNNGGGYMSVLSDVASYLISVEGTKKPVIAVAKDNKGNLEYFKCSGNNFNSNIEKIVVLANENTASASECLIGAMLYYGCRFSTDNFVIEKHFDTALLDYKATTYGKGIMQTTYKNYFNGEAIKLTTATIFWPDEKTTIQGKGLTTTLNNSVNKGEGLNRALEILS